MSLPRYFFCPFLDLNLCMTNLLSVCVCVCVDVRKKWHLRRNDPSIWQAREIQRWRASSELLRPEHHSERGPVGGDRHVPGVRRLLLQQPGAHLQPERWVCKGSTILHRCYGTCIFQLMLLNKRSNCLGLQRLGLSRFLLAPENNCHGYLSQCPYIE